MNFDIDDLLSKELITYSELETIKNELQDAIDESHDDELQEVLKVIESLIEQCEEYSGDDLCSKEYMYENVLAHIIDEIVSSIESEMGATADIVKANLDIVGMKDDLISDYSCVTITYAGTRYYFYII